MQCWMYGTESAVAKDYEVIVTENVRTYYEIKGHEIMTYI